ncbi:MAG: LytTR family DNA-binding domain-containing protein [Bacteroidota bacterium]
MTIKPQSQSGAKLIPLTFHKKDTPYLTKLAVSSHGKTEILCVETISCLTANGNYTTIHLNNNQKLTACITLKRFQNKLDPKQFLRVHQGSLVNANYITAYMPNSNMLIINNHMHIKVSRSNKIIIQQFIKQITP